MISYPCFTLTRQNFCPSPCCSSSESLSVALASNTTTYDPMLGQGSDSRACQHACSILQEQARALTTEPSRQFTCQTSVTFPWASVSLAAHQPFFPPACLCYFFLQEPVVCSPGVLVTPTALWTFWSIEGSHSCSSSTPRVYILDPQSPSIKQDTMWKGLPERFSIGLYFQHLRQRQRQGFLGIFAFPVKRNDNWASWQSFRFFLYFQRKHGIWAMIIFCQLLRMQAEHNARRNPFEELRTGKPWTSCSW